MKHRSMKMGKVRASHFWIVYLPILTPLIVIAVYWCLYDGLVLSSGPLALGTRYEGLRTAISEAMTLTSESEDQAHLMAFPGRLRWTLTVGLSSLTTLLAYVTAFVIAYHNSRNRATRIMVGVGALIAVLAPLLFLMSHSGDPVHPWRQLTHAWQFGDLPVAQTWTPGLDTFALIAGLCLAVAGSSLLWRSIPAGPDGVRELVKLHSHLRTILYVGAFLLVITTLRAATLYSWALAYFSPDPVTNLPVLQGVAKEMVLSQGVFYTVLLASIYLTAQAGLRNRIGTASLGDLPDEALDALSEISLWKSLPRFVAILSPLLTGASQEFFGLLG